MSLLQTLYWYSPYPLRSAIASFRGYYLRSWRYGSNTDQLVEAILERDGWEPDKWQMWQEEQLSYVLHRAATQVPYYRDLWQKRRQKGDRASWDMLANWPILDKEVVRQTPTAFVAEDCDRRRMFAEHTSGTSGTPLHLWWSQQTVQTWYALFEARVRRWHDISRQDRWAILGGQLVAPIWQKKPPFWVWNSALKQLYLSSYHLKEATVVAYLNALTEHHVTYLFGYASALYELAYLAQTIDTPIPALKVTISNAEPLFPYQRKLIEEVFQCPIRDTYGMAEIVCAASECQCGQMHLWPEVGWLEALDLNSNDSVMPYMEGSFICTSLLNSDMPFIRYSVGDIGVVAPQDKTCACGRKLPLLQSVEGRSDDLIVTPDGRRIGRLDPVFKVDMPIVEAQIIQETVEQLKILVVPAQGYTPQTGQQIKQRIQERVGNVHVYVEIVDKIPRTANGKFRAVVSQVTQSNH